MKVHHKPSGKVYEVLDVGMDYYIVQSEPSAFGVSYIDHVRKDTCEPAPSNVLHK